MIFLLAALKLTTARTSSPVGCATPRSYLGYFLITAAANTTVLVIQALGPRFDHTKPTVMPISTVITAAMGVRVYLNHQLFNIQQQQTSIERGCLSTASMANGQGLGIGTDPNPGTPRYSTSSGDATPRGGVSKAYEIEFFSMDVPRPDTPFGSYDYDDTPKDTKHFPQPVFTRETVVTVE